MIITPMRINKYFLKNLQEDVDWFASRWSIGRGCVDWSSSWSIDSLRAFREIPRVNVRSNQQRIRLIALARIDDASSHSIIRAGNRTIFNKQNTQHYKKKLEHSAHWKRFSSWNSETWDRRARAHLDLLGRAFKPGHVISLFAPDFDSLESCSENSRKKIVRHDSQREIAEKLLSTLEKRERLIVSRDCKITTKQQKARYTCATETHLHSTSVCSMFVIYIIVAVVITLLFTLIKVTIDDWFRNSRYVYRHTVF